MKIHSYQMLVFYFSDQAIYRHNRIFCTHWNGFDKAPLHDETIDDKEYSGSIVKLLYSALDFVKANTKKKWRKSALQTIEMPEYDELAVREAIVNAIIHREYTRTGAEVTVNIYKDRLEITSPGEVFSGKKIEKKVNKVVSSERRNPVIDDIFARMNFMERRGSGLKKITERTNALFKDQHNHVEFYCEDGFMNAVIYNANYENEPIKISQNAELLLKEIIKKPSISQPQLAEILGVSLSTVKRGVKDLTEANILIGKTSNKAGTWIIKK